jgi:hypothetical protein
MVLRKLDKLYLLFLKLNTRENVHLMMMVDLLDKSSYFGGLRSTLLRTSTKFATPAEFILSLQRTGSRLH